MPDTALVQDQSALSSQPQTIQLSVMFDHDFFLPPGKLFKADFAGALIRLLCGGIGIGLIILGGCHKSAPMYMRSRQHGSRIFPRSVIQIWAKAEA